MCATHRRTHEHAQHCAAHGVTVGGGGPPAAQRALKSCVAERRQRHPNLDPLKSVARAARGGRRENMRAECLPENSPPDAPREISWDNTRLIRETCSQSTFGPISGRWRKESTKVGPKVDQGCSKSDRCWLDVAQTGLIWTFIGRPLAQIGRCLAPRLPHQCPSGNTSDQQSPRSHGNRVKVWDKAK